MIRRPPRSTLDRSSAASDVYKRQTKIWIDDGNLYVGTANDNFFFIKDAARTKTWTDFKAGADKDSNYSVSYTHLRAHETVLDLVCRLLLEKKQTTNNNNNIIIMHDNTHKQKLHNQSLNHKDTNIYTTNIPCTTNSTHNQ